MSINVKSIVDFKNNTCISKQKGNFLFYIYITLFGKFITQSNGSLNINNLHLKAFLYRLAVQLNIMNKLKTGTNIYKYKRTLLHNL